VQAFGVDLTFNCSKPFIATGAMRPDTYISPDGRSNFFQAVAAASSPVSANRGGLIVFNDRCAMRISSHHPLTASLTDKLCRITSIYYSTKANANTPDTFKAIEQGNLGAFLGGQPYYFFDPSYPVGRPHFNVSDTVELPSVIILYGHRKPNKPSPEQNTGTLH
jgi:L-asparaginase